ncbi:MAG: hypothetical protein MAG451_01698 [Anaerolineales bacterium]|nr:hypothetical protein [Anaerolineales bacterium]
MRRLGLIGCNVLLEVLHLLSKLGSESGFPFHEITIKGSLSIAQLRLHLNRNQPLAKAHFLHRLESGGDRPGQKAQRQQVDQQSEAQEHNEEQ